MDGIRINKYVSQCGYCSRREADRLLLQGKIYINGNVASMGDRVQAGDAVIIDGKAITPAEKEIIIAFHKPAGIVCTTSKKEKQNVIDYLHLEERVYPVGRLDKNSTGLLLLTNNGQLMDDILRGSHYHEKEYIVTVDKAIPPAIYEAMEQGVPILNTMTRPCRITHRCERRFHIILTQGLNRQIRRMCEYFGYRVRTLKRIRIMNIELGNLPEGKWRYLTETEIRKLKQLAAGRTRERKDRHE
mgnify:FL=1